jgi:rhamnose transport system ATP-binding protein
MFSRNAVEPPNRLGMSLLLQLDSITKSFGAVRALKGVSFDLRPGEVHALLGENGAGKSTLIKVMTGAHLPEGGTMKIAGKDIEHLNPTMARALGIACIYQQPALFPDLSVAENIALRLESPPPFRRVRWADRNRRAAELLRRIGAHMDPESEIRSLSMPEQQLVEIACALGAGARVVIMDEPTASLTQKEQHLLFGIVRDLRVSGVGVIYISHRLEEIFALADRVTVLRDGESVGTDSIDNFTEAGLIRMMVGRPVSDIFPESHGKIGKPILSASGICHAASGIRDVSIDLREGEVLGLAGLVDSGRTEFARVLFGITPADRGEILFEGRRVCISSPREAIRLGIGYVPEDRRRHGVILEMPVEENISMAVHERLFPGTWLRNRRERSLALDYIKELGIKTPGPEARAGSLSGGNQQKVSLARWLAVRPRVLILDEPTQGIDVGAKAEIHKIIRQLAAQGMAILMISSDLPEVMGMSDRIAVMRGGTIADILPGKSAAHDVMAAALGKQS